MYTQFVVVALLFQPVFSGVVYRDDESSKSGMASMDMTSGGPSNMKQNDDLYSMPNYAGLSKHSSMMMAHIILMIVAWFFILPIGIVLNMARSRLGFIVQLTFLILNGLGVLLGTIYNVKTPDLYKNNAHHTIGWVATWLITAQFIIKLLVIYSRNSKKSNSMVAGRSVFLSLPMANMTQQGMTPYTDDHRSSYNNQNAESSSIHSNRDLITAGLNRLGENFENSESETDEEPETPISHRPRYLFNRFVDKCHSARIPRTLSSKSLKLFEILDGIIDRIILVLGFIALVTGGVTYTGIFRGKNIFNGLAHFIKGGIFFWYGLLTLGRWMGCFADFGWAWNVKPLRKQVGQWKSSVPSAEFVESMVIFLYGSTNVFLEHLAGWGGAWTAQDLEHVSISIMFLGGGLCGMLVESRTIEKWLNPIFDPIPTYGDVDQAQTFERQTVPENKLSKNPFPALIILALGIMMSSHHQDSMVSAIVHKQWGTLLAGFSMMRILTYIVMYISPTNSVYPSRPPTELISSFCLISGGIVFMASTRDVIYWMEVEDLMPMFVFTVTMGLTALIMAYEILVLSLKGWATRREDQKPSKWTSLGH